MSIFVMDCNEWITYHIADMLLENGYHVNALEASDNEEDLSMFFIRNSSFSMISGDVQKSLIQVSLSEILQVTYCMILNN